MSVLSSHPAVRWSVPAVVAVIAVGGSLLFSQLKAGAAATLPPRSAAQLLVDLQTAKVTALSGTVVQKADLGLPQLPNAGGGSGSSSLTSLISGSHTLRVWYAGPLKVRAALMGTLGESDVIRNGSDLWTWSSDDNTAQHRRLSGAEAKETSLSDLAAANGSPVTPQQAAALALAAIDPTTKVTTDGTAEVAGRSAYELILAPKDASSLVGQVRLAIDSARHVPLRVQVFAKGSTSSAIDIGFTQISFARPDDAEFRFTPPPGVKVSEAGAVSAPSSGSLSPGRSSPGSSSPAKAARAKGKDEGSATFGTGWTTVVAERLPGSVADSGPRQLAGVIRVLPKVSGSWGSGRLLQSKLVSVLITGDGRVLAGAVPPSRLYEVAGQFKSGAGS